MVMSDGPVLVKNPPQTGVEHKPQSNKAGSPVEEFQKCNIEIWRHVAVSTVSHLTERTLTIWQIQIKCEHINWVSVTSVFPLISLPVVFYFLSLKVDLQNAQVKDF